MRHRVIWGVVLVIGCGKGDDTASEDADPGTPATDNDSDGFGPDEDCDDSNGAINPGADEVCDGIDNNCDGTIDEGVEITIYLDGDRDGYGDSTTANSACEVPDGVSTVDGDCDDGNSDVSPAAQEVCNGIDDDCDALIDDDDDSVDTERGDLFYTDRDGDGYGDPSTETLRCAAADGWTTDSTDCDDTEAATYPGAEEICDDGVISDCDWTPDEAIDACAARVDYEVDAVIEGTAESGYLGIGAAGRLDHDGDGTDDIVVTAYSDTRAYIYYGGTSFGGDLTEADADATISGGALAESLGSAVAAAPDMDGDGADEIVLAHPTPLEIDGTPYDAAVFIIDGGQSTASVDDASVRLLSDVLNLGAHLGAGDLDDDGATDIFASNTTTTVHIFAAPSGDVTAPSAIISDPAGVTSYLGTALSVVDTDGDGDGELLVNAPLGDSGRVFLFASATVSGTVSWDDADITIQDTENTYFGLSADGLGDVNGDGYEDIVASDYRESLGDETGASAWVFWGPLDSSMSPDDADATVTTSDGTLLGYDAAGVGDVDGDGRADLVLAEPFANSGDHGGARLFYGADLYGTVRSDEGYLMDRTAYRDGPSYFSLTTLAGGDLNADGYADMLSVSHQDHEALGAASVTFGQPRY